MTMTPAELEAQKDTLELLNNEVASRPDAPVGIAGEDRHQGGVPDRVRGDRRAVLATHKHHDVLAYCVFAAYAISLLAGVQTFRVAEYKDLRLRHLVVSYVRLPKELALFRLASCRASLRGKPAPPPEEGQVLDPALIGTDKRNDTKPMVTRVVRPQGDTETHCSRNASSPATSTAPSARRRARDRRRLTGESDTPWALGESAMTSPGPDFIGEAVLSFAYASRRAGLHRRSALLRA
ncbi:hypothetical protein [Streptomyces sp. NPDC058812]|uniref:hypothetical protein n=1 Tax=unclassified Streptomyces TaxID=2593676 RepID=UPI003677C84A